MTLRDTCAKHDLAMASNSTQRFQVLRKLDPVFGTEFAAKSQFKPKA
ncbi:MAG: hypothetical protein HYY23_04200 [Verrucomicrobia bacterium]|nr:hypothetical protein [Verrucomicrobiota bacterium]